MMYLVLKQINKCDVYDECNWGGAIIIYEKSLTVNFIIVWKTIN